jgi:Flp pilus assembly pilin Flp
VVISRIHRSIVESGQLTERREGGEMSNLFALTHIRLITAYANLRDLPKREEGQGMTEYAVLVGAVIAMVLAVVGILTGKLTDFINGLTL